MAYIHKKCGGDISLFRRKCKKCGKVWNDGRTWLLPPKDWIMLVRGTPSKPTSYAKWGDKVPFAATVASMLPNWPRWARITAFVIYIVTSIVFIAWIIQGCT